MIYGKVIAGLIGLFVGGPIGLLFGVFIGHLFDRGLALNAQFSSPAHVARIQRSFFETCFLLLGHLAKADGRVSEAEVQHTQTLFQQMRLNASQREEAIGLFKRGASADFQLRPVVADFMNICSGQRMLTQTLLLFLISLALADHKLESAEHDVLVDVGRLFGYSESQLEQLLSMATAQGQFHAGDGGAATAGARLEDAYAALGISADVDDKALKRAYRKLMSEHHPDKLIARGVPEDMLKIATERAQEIQSAYDMVRRAREQRS